LRKKKYFQIISNFFLNRGKLNCKKINKIDLFFELKKPEFNNPLNKKMNKIKMGEKLKTLKHDNYQDIIYENLMVKHKNSMDSTNNNHNNKTNNNHNNKTNNNKNKVAIQIVKIDNIGEKK